MREVERRGHDHIRQGRRVGVVWSALAQQCAARFDQAWQHDEQVAGGKGRQQGVVAAAKTFRSGICVNAAMSPGKTQSAISSVIRT